MLQKTSAHNGIIAKQKGRYEMNCAHKKDTG